MPLHHYYATTPMHETIQELLDTQQAPIYVVHFTQASALERAQALMSVNVCSKEEKAAIADMIGGFRFSSAFGTTLSRLVRHGIGVHHAGMLPKYRRLVEQLAQAGLLKVICGTDTLGVGINVPIRTVVFSALSKYDGTRTRLLQVREFHQIAGRAGRAGYDTAGTVVVQAPEHEVENLKQFAKVADDPKKRRKLVRKKVPDGMVPWSESTMNRLVEGEPEKLTSNMRVSTAMILDVVDRPGDPVVAMRRLLTENHEPRKKQLQHIREAIGIARSLLQAGVLERLPEPEPDGRRYDLTVDLPPDFALNQPLSTFALAAIDLLDPDVGHLRRSTSCSVIEATLDDPRQILAAQLNKAKGEAVAQMKAEGIEYDERMELLEEVTYPKPLEELLDARVRGLRADQPVGRGRAPVAEVRRPRDVGAGVHLPGVRQHLRADPLRGRGAALPVRRVQGAAVRRPGGGAHRGGHRPRRVARRAGAPGRLLAARRVGAADLARPAARRAGRRAGPAAAADRQRAGVHRDGAQRAVPPGRADRAAPLVRPRLLDADSGWDADRWEEVVRGYFAEHGADARPACSSWASRRPDLEGAADPRRPGGNRLGLRRRGRLEASDEEGSAVIRLVDAGRKD